MKPQKNSEDDYQHVPYIFMTPLLISQAHFFYFCNTCFFLKFRNCSDVARRNIFYYIAVWLQSSFATCTNSFKKVVVVPWSPGKWTLIKLKVLLTDNATFSCSVVICNPVTMGCSRDPRSRLGGKILDSSSRFGHLIVRRGTYLGCDRKIHKCASIAPVIASFSRHNVAEHLF